MRAKAAAGKDSSSSEPGATKPKALPVCLEAIPNDLRELPCWVVWEYVAERDPETGKVDFDKPPLNARGGPGSSTNKRTWSTCEQAVATYRKSKLDGIGFVLSVKNGEEGEVLIGVDLDDCRVSQTGEIAEWARGVISTLNSYTEVSPSGEGIRIFLRGKLPPHGRKRGNFEVYCSGRYVTVTGQHVEGTPSTIESRQAELLAVHKQFWPEYHGPHKQQSASASSSVNLSDLDLIEKAKKARNGAGTKFSALWNGDTGGFTSRSEADLALCNYLAFWCGPNSSERIDALFRQSGLFRGKWNRADYRERTIRKALEGRTKFYEPRRGPRATLNGHHSTNETQSNSEERPTSSESFHLTDSGNAQRIVARHGADMRYCHPWKSYLVWDGKRFAVDDTGESVRRAKETQRSLYRWAAEQLAELSADEGDEDAERKAKAAKLAKVLQHALKWEDARRIAASLDLARSESGIPVRPADMDLDPWLLNVQNGTIGLHTGELRQHCRGDLLTKLAPVAYDAAATCPLWERCLETWMAGKRHLADYLRRIVGYALSGDVSEQVLFFLYGCGANGKSTFLNAVRELLGDYGTQAVSELLMAKKIEAHPTERADLSGRRFVATIETDEGKRLAEALLKQLTGGDNVKARRMRQDFFEMAPTWKIFLAANHKPIIRGTDFAVWRRIRLIPFTRTIGAGEKDKNLSEKLRTEYPGILAWAVRGCLEWQRNGLVDPPEVTEATAAYQREQDTLGEFLAECCTVADYAKVKASALLRAYQEFSGDKNVTQQGFRIRLRDKGFTSERGSGGNYYYHGVGLPADEFESVEG